MPPRWTKDSRSKVPRSVVIKGLTREGTPSFSSRNTGDIFVDLMDRRRTPLYQTNVLGKFRAPRDDRLLFRSIEIFKSKELPRGTKKNLVPGGRSIRATVSLTDDERSRDSVASRV